MTKSHHTDTDAGTVADTGPGPDPGTGTGTDAGTGTGRINPFKKGS